MDGERRYRIAMVAACPFPSLRGSQALIRELSEALAGRGHDVHVVTYPSAQHLAPVERMSIHRIRRLPFMAAAPAPIGVQKVICDLLLIWSLWRVVRRYRIDLIHAHNVDAPLVAYVVRLLTGVPVVYHAHNALVDELPYYFERGWARRLARAIGARIDRRVAAWSNHTIALSSRLGAYFSVRGAAAKTVVVPPALFPSEVRNAPQRRASGGAARIAYAGNLDRYQNVECLLEAFERVCATEPRSRLVLILHQAAHPALRERMKQLAARPGVSVRVVGTHSAVVKELRRADVLVCPRTSWSGFPIKTLNYMAAGRPIVQARGSAHGLAEGVTALLFDDGDPGALAKSILRVVRDPELGDRLGQASMELAARRYVWPVVLPEIEGVYRSVIADEDSASRRKSETLDARVDRMTAMRKSETRQLAQPGPDARRGRPIFASMLAGLVLIGCTAQQPPAAPLPDIPAPVVPGAVRADANYKIEPGDQLRVKFTYHPELDVKVPVAPDGNISIPGVGEVAASGKTVDEVAGEVERISSDQLRDPEVTVIVAEFGQRVVYVTGEVRLPGPVQYREGMTPLEAILDRGGFTEVARVDSVLHLHPNGTNYETTRLNFATDINETQPEMTTLQVYDTIIVPRTFIGDANAFVRLYIRGLLPTMPRVGVSLD